MIGVIKAVTPSKSGKALRVQVGTEWLGAKKDQGIGPESVGKSIEVEIEDGEYGKWIKAWKSAVAPAGNGSAPAQQALTATGINLAFLPFVSNCVAHAIQSGQCTGPAEIGAWANAAYTAVSNLKDAAAE